LDKNSKTTQKIKKRFCIPFFSFLMLEYFQTMRKLEKSIEREEENLLKN
jgi:hypothetical protein